MTYGSVIPNLKINGVEAPYPVVNERAIRATAGIMFALGFFTLLYTIFHCGDMRVAQFVVPLFTLDFLLKVINPLYSPLGFLGRLLTKNQKPEYVGAIQKRFAWLLGLIMASAVSIILFVFQIRGPLPIILCSICLLLMWLESACGICVGCKIYYWLVDKKLIKKPDVNPACPGGVCDIKH